MARNTIPGLKSGGGLPKLVGLALVATLVVLLIKYPNETAGWVSGLVHGIGNLIDGLATVFRKAAG
jgi:hypothetical protein